MKRKRRCAIRPAKSVPPLTIPIRPEVALVLDKLVAKVYPLSPSPRALLRTLMADQLLSLALIDIERLSHRFDAYMRYTIAEDLTTQQAVQNLARYAARAMDRWYMNKKCTRLLRKRILAEEGLS